MTSSVQYLTAKKYREQRQLIIDHLKSLGYVQTKHPCKLCRGVYSNGSHEERMDVYNTHVIYFNSGFYADTLTHEEILKL